MTLAGFFATIAAYIVQFGFFFGGGSSYGDDDDNPSFLVLFLVSLAVYVISFFLMQALSRYREFAADRGAAIITGRPSALASALVKISGGMQRIPQKRPAHGRRAAGVLHLPRGRRQGARRPLLHAPADGEAHRRPAAPRGAAPGHRLAFTPMGFLDVLRGKRQLKKPVPDRPRVRDDDGADHARDGARAEEHRQGRRSSSSRSRPPTSSRSCATWRRSCAAPARRPARRSRSPTTSSATAG